MSLTLTRHKAQNQYYDEHLAEGVLSLRMMYIPAGVFLMGAPDTEFDRPSLEEPPHEVHVSSFFMGKYPVTQAQWQIIAELPQIKRELAPDPSNFKGANRPVERVSWYDAVEFCARLTNLTHRVYRLPTEAEWEYACRAGSTTPFNFGKTMTTELANYRGTDDEQSNRSDFYGKELKAEYWEETTPVDQFEGANKYGLCDMHGNVWEWCQDHWHHGYEGAPTDGSAWFTNDEQADRVLRGGSWYCNLWDCRSASRYYYLPALRDNDVGFRVVCSAPKAL